MNNVQHAIAFHDVFTSRADHLRTLYGAWACGTFDNELNYAVIGSLHDAITQAKLMVYADIFIRQNENNTIRL